MHFEIAQFLETLKGLNKEEAYKMISHQQHILMHYVSQPKTTTDQKELFRSLRDKIDFLNKLGLEVGCEFATPSTFIERHRIDSVLNNLSDK